MQRDKKPFVMQTQALDLVFELIDCYYKVTSKKNQHKIGQSVKRAAKNSEGYGKKIVSKLIKYKQKAGEKLRNLTKGYEIYLDAVPVLDHKHFLKIFMRY